MRQLTHPCAEGHPLDTRRDLQQHIRDQGGPDTPFLLVEQIDLADCELCADLEQTRTRSYPSASYGAQEVDLHLHGGLLTFSPEVIGDRHPDGDIGQRRRYAAVQDPVEVQ